MSKSWKLVATAALCAACVAAFATSALAAAGGGATAGVHPPGSNPYGRSYGDWTAAWWRWAFSLPMDGHPLFDTADCNAGQAGPVWFLGGAFTGVTTTRTCTVPAGTSILFPAVNVECSSVEPPPFYGGNEAELRDCVHTFMAFATEWFAYLDGNPLPLSRVESSVYDFTAVPGSLFGNTEPLSGISMSDGQWVFLTPLSAGSHTLRLGGRFDFPDGSSFPLDVTYELTVQPGGRRRGGIASEPGVQARPWGVVKSIYR